MLNKNLLKSFLVGSWLLVIYAATPYSPEGTRWLAGVVLSLSYLLCGVVFGTTDQEALKVVERVRNEATGWHEILISDRNRNNADLEALTKKVDEALTKVSKAISELRRLDSQRFE